MGLLLVLHGRLSSSRPTSRPFQGGSGGSGAPRARTDHRRSTAIEVDLTDQEWAILEPLLPLAKPGGRPRTSDLREVITAILYVDRTGGQWRALPHDFLPWSTVWGYFRTWRVPRDLGAPAYDAAGTDAREAGARAHPQRGDH